MSFVSKRRIVATEIMPTKNNVLVTGMEFGERFTTGGLIIPGDDRTERGIHPRWALVVAVGPKQDAIKPGEWILVDHGRWTHGLDVTDPNTGETMTVRLVDPKDIFMSMDEKPVDEIVWNTNARKHANEQQAG